MMTLHNPSIWRTTAEAALDFHPVFIASLICNLIEPMLRWVYMDVKYYILSVFLQQIFFIL